jgi:DNA-binding NarL/FixJ family response regulator
LWEAAVPSIVIADDHQLFAESLRSLLSPAYEVLGIATNGRELIDLAVQHKPNMILSDVSMPIMNGLDALNTLKKMGLRSKFVMLTMHFDLSVAVEVFRGGASAFVMKTASSEELKEALQTVYRGGYYLSPQFPCDLVTVLAEAARRPAGDKEPQLTPRQREVLQLVAEGKSMKEVAAQLKLSTRTAESHKYQLMKLLGIRTNAELVQHAIKIGLINVQTFKTFA